MKISFSPLIQLLACCMIIALVVITGCTYLSIPGLPKSGSSQSEAPVGSQRGDAIPANYTTYPPSNAVPGSDTRSSQNGPGSQTCDATVNFQTDSKNCGECGAECPPNSNCGGGQCACDTGYSVHSNQCVLMSSGPPSASSPDTSSPTGTCDATTNFSTDNKNCGQCGGECPDHSSCDKGVCPCDSGYEVRSNQCVLSQSNVNAPTTCSVTFSTYNPEVNAEIYVDNADTGHTTPYMLSIPSGDHTATFKKVGYYDKSMPFTVTVPTAGGICSQAIIVPMNSQSGTTTVTTASNGGICGSRNEGTFCSGLCVNLKASKDNCGTCSNKCPMGNSCINGQCTPTSCSNNMTMCNGNCWNLEFAPVATNCGGCGQTCPPGNYCVFGVCQPLPCPPPTHNCSAGLCCKAGSDNPCDSLNKPGYSFCVNYVNMTFMSVYDACKNFQTDVNNCGSCGSKCPGICDNGKCLVALRPAITIKPTIRQIVPSAAPSWTGTWTMTVTKTGPITMTQSGSSVSGTYINSYGQTGCTISGSVTGNILKGTWHEGTGSGPFEFDLATSSNNFIGWWGLTSTDLAARKIKSPGGNWNGNK